MPRHPSSSDSHREIIDAVLRSVRKRLGARRLLENIASDLVIALSLFLVVLCCSRLLLPGLADPWLLFAILATSLVVSGFRTLAFQIPTRFDASVALDRTLALKERVASAYVTEEDSSAELEAVRTLLCRDAAGRLNELRPGIHFPIRLPKAFRSVALLLVVCSVVALWLPTYDFLGTNRSAVATTALKDALEREKEDLARKFAELEKKLAEKKDSDSKDLLALLRPEVANQSEQGEKKKSPPEAGAQSARPVGKRPADPRKAALVEFSRREEAIRKGMRKEDFKKLENARKALQTLGLKDVRLTRKLREALKEGEFEKAQKELEALRKKLDRLAKKKPSELSAEEKKELADLQEELAKLSRDAAAMKKLSGGLSRASSGLKAGDLGEGLEGLELSLEDLGDLASLQGDMDTLEQALQLVQASKQQAAGLCKKCGAKPGSRPGGT